MYEILYTILEELTHKQQSLAISCTTVSYVSYTPSTHGYLYPEEVEGSSVEEAEKMWTT